VETSLRVKHDFAKGPPCELCTALCCKYFALQIDKPATPSDYDQIRWYLVHQDVLVWVQDDDWYLEVRNRCKHLLPDNRCDIYDTRPDVCRDYPDPADMSCEYETENLKYDLFFDNAELFQTWVDKQLKKRDKRLAKRRAKRKKKKNKELAK
jgi:Fe-S-cluster containining protein